MISRSTDGLERVDRYGDLMRDFDTRRFAVIADIHSNADALRAVLQDIARQDVESIVNLGDHLSGPMAARETAELLLDADMPSVRGNHDRWLVETEPANMISIDRAAFDQLKDRHLDWLRALPPTLRLSEDVFACHGTPDSDTTYWMEAVSTDGDVVLRSKEEIVRDADGVDASLMLCGHTHLPRRIDLPDGRVILNPAASGAPATSMTSRSATSSRRARAPRAMPSPRRCPVAGPQPSDTCPMILAG